MKLTIESTTQLVDISTDDSPHAGRRYVPGRVWVGKTDSGIPVQLVVTRVAVQETERQEEFERELTVQHAPKPEPLAFPLRMIL